MEVKSLTVKRRESYESDAGQLVGTVELVGSGGAQIIRLSNESLGKIFAVIKDQIVQQAKLNTAQIDLAVSNAASEPLLLKAATVETDGIPF